VILYPVREMKMNKTGIRWIIFVCVLPILTTFSCERHKKTYTVGILNPSQGFEEVVKSFKEGMAGQGYKEGKNIRYIDKGPLAGPEEVDKAIRAMLAQDVDLIYSLSTPASRKLKKALEGTDVPGVFGPVFDPVSSGIVESVAKPGGQMTGVKVRGSTAKALEWFLAVVPGAKQIFVPFHSTDKAASQTLEDLREATSLFKVELITGELTNEKELDAVLQQVPKRADAIWVTCSHLLLADLDKIVQAANNKKIPAASSTHLHSKSGVLVSYGESDAVLGKQVSRIAGKIIRGMSPGDIPVENAEYELIINLQAAHSLGIEVPEEVLKQADLIIR